MEKVGLVLATGIILIFLIPIVCADTYFIIINETSPLLYDSGSFSLEDVEVEITCNLTDLGFRDDNLKAVFTIKNLENKSVETILYLKARGYRSAYGGYEEEGEGIYFEVEGDQVYGEPIEISGEKFASMEYTFQPNQEVDLEVYGPEIGLPLYYYLDGLDSYETLKHEKITVRGYCDAEFNDYYPIDLKSENSDGYKEWEWEYSDVDTSDPNLKDILIITEADFECTPNWECREWSDWTCNESLPYYMHKGARLGVEARTCYDGCGNSRKEYRECKERDSECSVNEDCYPQGFEPNDCGAFHSCINGKCVVGSDSCVDPGNQSQNQTRNQSRTQNKTKIMPEVASERAIERLGELNFTIILKEVPVRNSNQTRLLYEAKAKKQGRFLGLFKVRGEVSAEIDAETGEVVSIKKPWWAFLASGI